MAADQGYGPGGLLSITLSGRVLDSQERSLVGDVMLLGRHNSTGGGTIFLGGQCNAAGAALRNGWGITKDSQVLGGFP